MDFLKLRQALLDKDPKMCYRVEGYIQSRRSEGLKWFWVTNQKVKGNYHLALANGKICLAVCVPRKGWYADDVIKTFY